MLQYLYLGPKWKAVFQVVQFQLTSAQGTETEDSGAQALLCPCPVDPILKDSLSNCASSFIMVNMRRDKAHNPAGAQLATWRVGPHPTPSQHCAGFTFAWHSSCSWSPGTPGHLGGGGSLCNFTFCVQSSISQGFIHGAGGAHGPSTTSAIRQLHPFAVNGYYKGSTGGWVCVYLFCLRLDISYWSSEVSTHLQNGGY